MKKLEVCCMDIESVIAAKAGGADRIELCSALEVGGLTPSIGLIEESVKIFGKGVYVLIRVRPGDFVYTKAEIEVMKLDVEACVKAGAGGVVVGALTADGEIDVEGTKEMMTYAEGVEVTFHRAFDRAKDAKKALEEIIGLGCDRILTSGQRPSAFEGKELLKEINEQANGRIKIMPGAGVTFENAGEILKTTGCDEIHASAKTDNGDHMQTSKELVKKIKEVINF